jgi:hypothetical protein
MTYIISRAQARIERQRLEAKVPLTKVIEMRKRLLAQLKVGEFQRSVFCPLSHSHLSLCEDDAKYWIANRRRPTYLSSSLFSQQSIARYRELVWACQGVEGP